MARNENNTGADRAGDQRFQSFMARVISYPVIEPLREREACTLYLASVAYWERARQLNTTTRRRR